MIENMEERLKALMLVEELKIELERNSKELEVLRKAYGLMAKDYCENMGCAFCDHHAKCLEANHFEGLDGKDFLQKMFIDEATPASEVQATTQEKATNKDFGGNH